jgi:hypothetical protein
MEHSQFMNKVLKRAQIDSYLTYKLSKRKYFKLHKWFIRQARRSFNWTRERSEQEWERFIKAFNITINTIENGTT